MWHSLRFCRRIALASLVWVVAVAPVYAQSGGDSRAQAKAAFERGVADYGAGRYGPALDDFQEAFRIRPHPLVNVNIANCYDKLGKPQQALFHFQRFLESDAGSAAQRAEVTTAVERLRQQVGKLFLRITPDGALAIIDQGEPRKAPLVDALQLDAGAHALEVRLNGYKTVQRALTIRGGSTLELNIALEPEGAAAPVMSVTPVAAPVAAVPPATAEPGEPEPEPAPAPAEVAEQALVTDQASAQRSRRLPTEAWVVGGVSLALVAVATITGLLALHANSDFENAKSARFDLNATSIERLASYNDARDAADRANALALTTDILLGGALIGAAATIYFVASAQSRERAQTRSSASLAPLLSAHVAGLQLRSQL